MDKDWAIKAFAKKNSKSIQQFQHEDQEDLSDKLAEISYLQAEEILSEQLGRKRRRAPVRDRENAKEMEKMKKVLQNYGIET